MQQEIRRHNEAGCGQKKINLLISMYSITNFKRYSFTIIKKQPLYSHLHLQFLATSTRID